MIGLTLSNGTYTNAKIYTDGTRTHFIRITIQHLQEYLLNNVPFPDTFGCAFSPTTIQCKLVLTPGLEPGTSTLSEWLSNQLLQMRITRYNLVKEAVTWTTRRTEDQPPYRDSNPVFQPWDFILNTSCCVYLLVPPLRAARSFSDFQSGPITGFGLRGQVFKVVPPPLGYQLKRYWIHKGFEPLTS